jgi:hypothetical protein
MFPFASFCNEMKNSVTLPARVSPDLHKRVVQFQKKLMKQYPGTSPSLSDTVRVLLERGLDEPIK